MQILHLSYFILLSIGMVLGYGQSSYVQNADDQSMCGNVAYQIDILKSTNGNLRLRVETMDQHFDKQMQNYEKMEEKFHGLQEKLQELEERLMEQQAVNQNELKSLIESTSAKNCAPQQSDLLSGNEKSEFLNEFQKVTKLQENILTKLNAQTSTSTGATAATKGGIQGIDSAVVQVDGFNVCWGVYTKILGELNSNLTILQNIDTKLKQLNEQHIAETDNHKNSLQVTDGLLRFLNKKEDTKICVRSDDEKLMCTEEPHPASCADHDTTHCDDAKCRIRSALYGPETFLVPCDDATDGGGWTIIQRRINGSVDFYRDWSEYKSGFGNLDGEFWLGLDKLHSLTASLEPMELLIQLKDHNDTLKYAKYSKFSIGSELEQYKLKDIEGYEGNAGDSFSIHKGQKFTTKDKDNDNDERVNCAVDKRGAWWYDSCQWSNLNGLYYKDGKVPENRRGSGINWGLFHGFNYSLKFVQMLIRPKKI